MTTENTGSPHDPDYNISVSSTPDRIPEGYVPPAGSDAAETYDPNKHYSDFTHDRAMDTLGNGPDPEYCYPDHPPDMTQDLLHRILSKVHDVNELKTIVLEQQVKIDEIHVMLETTLRDLRSKNIMNEESGTTKE